MADSAPVRLIRIRVPLQPAAPRGALWAADAFLAIRRWLLRADRWRKVAFAGRRRRSRALSAAASASGAAGRMHR